MPINNRRKDDPVRTPFQDPAFRRHSVHFDDIEFQRRFEQNLIRFGLMGKGEVTKEINNSIVAIGGGGAGGGGDFCLWTLEGSNIVRWGGNVGVGVHPHSNDFEVRGNVLVEAIAEQPYVEIRNWSDTEYDPVIHWSVGATPVKKYTMGVDDSDADAWLLCSGDILTSVVVPADPGTLVIGYTGKLGVPDFGDASTHRIKTILSDNTLAYVSHFPLADGAGDDQAGSIVSGICSDGTYYYIVDMANDRIKKHRISDGLFMWAVGTTGTGDDQFNTPFGICTDGTYLYITDRGNNRIKKHLCSDGSFVAKAGSFGVGEGEYSAPWGICTNGTHLWVIQYNSGGACPRIIRLTTDLIFVSYGPLDPISHLPADDGHLDNSTTSGICTDGNYLYIVNTNGGSMTNCIYKYTLAMVWVSDYGAYGTDDDEFESPFGICTDGTYLYIVNQTSFEVKKHRADDFSFVSKIGSYGAGDDQFGLGWAICVDTVFSWANSSVFKAPILKAGLDGSYCDSYPLFRARDGFQLMEDGTVAATKYVGLYAPASISASYSLTFPGTGPSAAAHFAVDASGNITWGQSLVSTTSPTFAGITIGSLNGILKATAGVVSAITDNSANWDLAYGWGDHGVEGYLKTLALDGLSDVDAPSPNDGDVLTWESANSSWKPKAP